MAAMSRGRNPGPSHPRSDRNASVSYWFHRNRRLNLQRQLLHQEDRRQSPRRGGSYMFAIDPILSRRFPVADLPVGSGWT